MFSDHLRKVDELPTRALLLLAAGLVIICQLVAMVMVADGQVERAQLREARQATARAATAWCIESSRDAALRDCDRSSPSAHATSEQASSPSQGITLVTLSDKQ